MGFPFAGMQNGGGHCFCGTTYGKYGALPLARCAGKTWANDVYDLRGRDAGEGFATGRKETNNRNHGDDGDDGGDDGGGGAVSLSV